MSIESYWIYKSKALGWSALIRKAIKKHTILPTTQMTRKQVD